MRSKFKKRIAKYLVTTIVAIFSFIYANQLVLASEFKTSSMYELAYKIRNDPRIEGAIVIAKNNYIIIDAIFKPKNIYREKNMEIKAAEVKIQAAYVALKHVDNTLNGNDANIENDGDFSVAQYFVPKPLEDKSAFITCICCRNSRFFGKK